jgi:hypothetical protein
MLQIFQETIDKKSTSLRYCKECLEIRLECGEVIGSAVLLSCRPLDCPPLVYLYDLKIFTSFQGNGYGGEILEYINNNIQGRSSLGILFNAIDRNLAAYNMYQRHGWKNIESDWYMLGFAENQDTSKLIKLAEQIQESLWEL